MARFGVLTGGGDCPGLNAVIRAIVRRGQQHGHEFFGYRYGWAGVLSGDGAELTAESRAGSCTAAGRSSAPRGRTRTRRRTGSSACAPRWSSTASTG